MKHQLFTGGAAQTNGYFIPHPHGNILIDAPAGITTWLKKQQLTITHLLLTHQHYDHVEDAAKLQQLGAQIYAHSPYSPQLTLETRLKSWNPDFSLDPYPIHHLLTPSTSLKIHDNQIFEISHVPGHSPDSITFFQKNTQTLYSGDTLFAQSIGRTDLPGGNHKTLITKITQELLTLPPETHVFPGHGPSTSITKEIQQNPFL